MNVGNIKNKKSFIIIAIFILVVNVFYCAYITQEQNHHCEDESHCPICQTIAICKDIKKGTVNYSSIITIAMALIYIFKFLYNAFNIQVKKTLVKLKIRLDN